MIKGYLAGWESFNYSNFTAHRLYAVSDGRKYVLTSIYTKLNMPPDPDRIQNMERHYLDDGYILLNPNLKNFI